MLSQVILFVYRYLKYGHKFGVSGSPDIFYCKILLDIHNIFN